MRYNTFPNVRRGGVIADLVLMPYATRLVGKKMLQVDRSETILVECFVFGVQASTFMSQARSQFLGLGWLQLNRLGRWIAVLVRCRYQDMTGSESRDPVGKARTLAVQLYESFKGLCQL